MALEAAGFPGESNRVGTPASGSVASTSAKRANGSRPNRTADFLCQALSIKPLANAVLVTDGYAAYKQYAEKTGIQHALRRSHARRGFFEALTAEPTGAAEASEQIKAVYAGHWINISTSATVELYYWRDRGQEVDFIVKAHSRLTAIEVKSGRAPASPIPVRRHSRQRSKLSVRFSLATTASRWKNS